MKYDVESLSLESLSLVLSLPSQHAEKATHTNLPILEVLCKGASDLRSALPKAIKRSSRSSFDLIHSLDECPQSSSNLTLSGLSLFSNKAEVPM